MNSVLCVYTYIGYIEIYFVIIMCNIYFICSSEDGDTKADEAEEVRSGDEETVEPEEEPEGINQKTYIRKILQEIFVYNFLFIIFFINFNN